MTDMTIEEELSITCEQRDALDIECARLEKENEALRKDAERYRWLRNDATDEWDVTRWIDSDTQEILFGDDLDNEIDAAMNGANS